MTTVLIVDDQDLVRAGLRAVLATDPSLDVVGEARDGREALALARRHRPDVVLMDLRMPHLDGIAATRLMCEDPDLRSTRVLVLTTFDDDADVLESVRAGAAGYVLKDTGASELRQAVHVVAAGGSLLSPQVARIVMERLATTLPTDPRDDLVSALTGRELDVLRRVAHGETNAEIGASLHLSPATARTYVSRLLAKLGARDRTQLAIWAHRRGLHLEKEPGASPDAGPARSSRH